VDEYEDEGELAMIDSDMPEALAAIAWQGETNGVTGDEEQLLLEGLPLDNTQFSRQFQYCQVDSSPLSPSLFLFDLFTAGIPRAVILVLLISRRILDAGSSSSGVDCEEADKSVHTVELNKVLIGDGDALW